MKTHCNRNVTAHKNSHMAKMNFNKTFKNSNIKFYCFQIKISIIFFVYMYKAVKEHLKIKKVL